MHRTLVTETRETQAIALVALPEIAETLQNAGYEVVTDQTTQTALKALTSAVKTGPVPALVSNVGHASLLRTGTRRAIQQNGGVPVVVLMLEGGYTDYVPDKARVVHAPCPFNDLLDALDLPRNSAFDDLLVNADGSVVNADGHSQPSHTSTYDNAFATEDSSVSGESDITDEFVSETVEAPLITPVTEVAVDEPVPAAPPVPSVPEVPALDPVAQSHDEIEPVEPQVPSVPEVPEVPSLSSVEPTPAPAPEPTSVVPADVVARAALTPGEWILQYDDSGEETTESAVGAWYAGPDGVVDEDSYVVNPRYVPADQRASASTSTPAAPESVVRTVENEGDLATSEPVEVSAEEPEPVYEAPVAPPVETPAPVAPPAAAEPAPVLPEPVVPAAPVYEAPVAPVAPPVATEPAAPAPVTPPVAPSYEAPVAPPVPEPVHEAPVAPQPTAIPQPVSEAPPVLAHDSHTGHVNETYERTNLTAADNPVSMQRDDSYLDVRKRPHGKGDVVIVWGAKGGVGKTTTALNLAQRAAASGLRVVLIDANFGQGDIRQYLRLAKANIPSIYDAAISRDLKDAFVGPDTINHFRPDGLDDIKFVYVAAPPENLADPSIVTPELYSAVIATSTHFADLVVVDTQIVEAVDMSGMVTRLIEPLLQETAWGVGVSDLSSPGMKNLFKRLDYFEEQQVPSSRMMTLLNKVDREAAFNEATLGKVLNKNSKFLGTVFHDHEIYSNMNLGRTASDVLALYPMLDTILATITGQQPPQVSLTSSAPVKKRRRGLFGWKAGK